jgi:hypothetical protein
MSGFEVAGIILGVLPVVVSCAQHYRKGLEPLDEWYHFQTRFIEFIHSIRHQEMKFRRNVVELLRPMLDNEQELQALIRNLHHPRWSDGSLNDAFDKRLGEERDRFVYTLGEMGAVMKDLEKLLQIENGRVCRRLDSTITNLLTR